MALIKKDPKAPAQGIAAQFFNPAMMNQRNSTADAMASGAAFAPFRAPAQEGQARNQQYQRAQIAAMLNKAGMANSGFGSQMARSSTANMRGQAFQNKLATQQAQAEMQARGATMQQQQQQLNQDAAARGGQLALGEAQMRSGEQQAAAGRNLQREQIGENTRLSREKMAQDAMLESSRLGLSKQQLAQEKELAMGEQGLKGRSLDIQEKQWTDELGLKQQDMDLRKQLGLEDLSLRSRALSSQEQQAAKELDLKFKELEQRDKQIMAQIDLGREELTMKDRQFLRQMGLSESAQKWLESYQTQSLSLQEKDIESRNRGYDIQERGLGLQEEEQGWAMDPNNPNNRLREAEATKSEREAENADYHSDAWFKRNGYRKDKTGAWMKSDYPI